MQTISLKSSKKSAKSAQIIIPDHAKHNPWRGSVGKPKRLVTTHTRHSPLSHLGCMGAGVTDSPSASYFRLRCPETGVFGQSRIGSCGLIASRVYGMSGRRGFGLGHSEGRRMAEGRRDQASGEGWLAHSVANLRSKPSQRSNWASRRGLCHKPSHKSPSGRFC